MATVIQIKDIDDVLANLSYTNPNTQKYKLVQTIRQFYLIEDSAHFPKEIEATDLVKALWDTGDDPALIKSKKKSLSSTKSAVNADLKKLYQEGGNPSGIIIGRNNIFDLSDEAKNKALTQLAESLKGAKEGVIGKVSEVLETINHYLSNPETLAEQGTNEGLKKLDGMKQLVVDLCRKVGLSAGDITGAGLDSGTGSSLIDASLRDAGDKQGGSDVISVRRPDESVLTHEGKDKPPFADIKVLESVDEYEEIPPEGAVEAYELEQARDAAWQSLASEEAAEDDLLSEEAPPELEDVIVETAAEEELLEATEDIIEDTVAIAADEIVEDVVGDDVLEEVQILDGDLQDQSATLAEPGLDSMPAEDLETAPPVAEDVIVETAADEEPLEIADEIVEEVVEGDLIKEAKGTDVDLQGKAETSGGPGRGPMPGEASREAGPGVAMADAVTDVSLDEIPIETEDILAETADEIVEEVVIAKSDEYAAGPEAVEPCTDGVDDEPLSGPVPTEDSGATGAEPALEELIEAEASPEEGVPVTEDVLAETVLEEEPLESADEIIEEVADEERPEESEELLEDVAEEDLRTKADVLANLAEAARILEKLGPDFEDSIYNEEEIKEKADLLSEEFERNLAFRDKFYNQHIMIKKGIYPMGSKEPKDRELVAQTIFLPEFYIGKFPVTNALFEIFIENTGYKTTAEKCGYGHVYSARGRKERDPRTGRERFVWRNYQEHRVTEGACWYQPSGPGSSIHDKRRHPVVQVSLEDARAFAAWTGKRIPTESEWEAAARTRLGYLFPWGNEWKEKACNVEKSYIGDTTPVDQYLESCNGAGLADTLGNVMEWTLDAWTNPAGEKDPQSHVTKGGSWTSNGSLSLSSRFRVAKNMTSNILGFRCVAI